MSADLVVEWRCWVKHGGMAEECRVMRHFSSYLLHDTTASLGQMIEHADRDARHAIARECIEAGKFFDSAIGPLDVRHYADFGVFGRILLPDTFVRRAGFVDWLDRANWPEVVGTIGTRPTLEELELCAISR